MKTLDRYIAKMYLLNCLILFMVVVLLIVVIDLIVNADEFIQAGQLHDSYRWFWMLWAAVDYYGPMMFLFYAYMGGLVAVAGMGFTLTSMIRNRELIALLAGGVSMYRITLPFVVVAGLLNVGIMIDQEWIIPALASKLGRGQNHVKQGSTRTFDDVFYVADSQKSLFSAGAFTPAEKKLEQVTILQRQRKGKSSARHHVVVTARVTAEQAVWDPQRRGWQLTGGLISHRRVPGDDLEVGTPKPIDFYATDLDPVTLVTVKNAHFRSMLSLRQIWRLAGKPKLVDVRALRRIAHARFSLPVLNMLVLLIGLHFFCLRNPQNMLMPSIKALVICVGTWGSGFMTMQSAMQLSPAAVAWLPIVITTPVAYYMYNRIET